MRLENPYLQKADDGACHALASLYAQADTLQCLVEVVEPVLPFALG